jgi:hypothetical protein
VSAVRTLATVLAIAVSVALTASSIADAQPLPAPSPTDNPSPLVGVAATDTVGGWLPAGVTLSPFDVANPIVGNLDPALLKAIQQASQRAEAEDIAIRINSGWRSRGFQRRLFDDGVRTYGSVDAAREFVASPDTSEHVVGKAVDIAPEAADKWLIANGAQFGLCQIYANEMWHFELAADDHGRCPPLKPNAAG